ncbi:MAG: DUF1553 domain-containing protein [Planctomycetes bacterium]|nr:DUF1553 domain-containing protein [Planctomycetota bacterium]
MASCAANVARADTPNFSKEVVPVFYKLGCSVGACHGSFSGKGSFRLSLFASDPVADFREVRGGLGRRLNTQNPDESLLLLKPTGRVLHGGGVKLNVDSDEYRLIRQWIAAGGNYRPESEGKVVSVNVEPPTFTLLPGASPTSLKVIAKFLDGSSRDVTRFARFEAYDATIAEVDETGRVTAKRSGDSHILAHYAGQIGFTIALVPQKLPDGVRFPDEKHADAIDRQINDKLSALNIIPSDRCDDNTFVRRVHLDVIGQLPTAEEVRKFLADKSPDKRAQLIDELLKHPLHSAVWATKLCDITGMDNRVLYDRAVCNAHDWYRNKLEANWPWDKIVQNVLTATAADGRTEEELAAYTKKLAEDRKKKVDSEPITDMKTPWKSGYALRNSLDVFFDNNKFRVQAGADKGKLDPLPMAMHAATAFLGVRLECAECHKHPHDRWSQEDFLGFTAAFSFINRGVDPALAKKKITIVGIHVTEQSLPHFMAAMEGKSVVPRVLGGDPIDIKPGTDPRAEIFKWMAGPNNPYFARAIVNRVWANYFGRGLIDPVDSLSAAYPPSHPGVLDELVKDFVAHKYDLRHLHRRIMNTAAYQRSWVTNASNAKDERNYSHRVLRRMTAEQVLDAVAQSTGTPVVLAPVYSGDPNRKPERSIEFPLSRPGGADSYLLKIFDKPQRTQSCDCERGEMPNLSQSLYFYNDQALISKVTNKDGKLAKLLAKETDDGKLLDEIYLITLSRMPTQAERDRSASHMKESKSRTEGFEDLFWSLLNRQEFLVTH